MVKIIRPTEQALQSPISISVQSTGQEAIGQQVLSEGIQSQQFGPLSSAKQLSALVDKEGKRMFEESKVAHQSATLLNKTTEASEIFIKEQQQRYSEQTDENGNPKFDTLHEDIEEIGTKILNDTASTIIDSTTQQLFRERFGGYIANQKISALKVARKQQVSFGRGSLNTGLKTLIGQATSDDIDQLGTYEQQGIESLQAALGGGIISPEEFEKFQSAFTVTIREGAIQTAITTDRPRAIEMLTMSAGELGLPINVKARLDRNLAAAIRSDEIQAKKATERQTLDEMTEEASLVESIEAKMEAGSLREDEYLSLEGKISDKSFKALGNKFKTITKRKAKESRERAELTEKIINNEDISDIGTTRIDDLFGYMVAQHSDTVDRDVTLSEEAQIAASIPAPVKAFSKKLSNQVRFGDTQNAGDMLAAYTYIKDRNKPTLGKGIDNDTTLIMEHTELLVTKANLSPQKALVEARDSVLGANKEVREIRNSLFNREQDFKDINIEETAAEELDAESFFGENRISQDAIHTFRDFAREGFIKTGNIDTAVSYAKALMEKTHGHSSVGARETYMFAPPEKAFPQLTSDQLREILITEATPFLPEGIDPDTVSISSDDITIGQVQAAGTKDGVQIQREVQSWIITYTTQVDGDDIEVPLLNENTGQPKRWTPLGSTVLEEKQAKELEETKKQREEFVSKTSKGVTAVIPPRKGNI